MARFAILMALAGCWRGEPPSTPRAPTPTTTPTPRPDASARAVECEDGRKLVILAITSGNARFTIELAIEPNTPIPRVFEDGHDAVMSPCLHGCAPGRLELDAMVIGKRAHGHYTINANAGPHYEGDFEASWIGTPWMLDRCDPETY